MPEMVATSLPAAPRLTIVRVTTASEEDAFIFRVPALFAALIAAAIFVAN